MFEILPFNALNNIELEDEFMTSADKLIKVSPREFHICKIS